MRSKLSIILDATVLFLALWLLLFAWIKFYSKNAVLSAIFGATLSGLVVFLVFFLMFKKSEKTKLSGIEKRAVENLALNLNFTPETSVLEYFAACLSTEYKIDKIIQNSIILTPNSSQNDMHSTVHSILFVPFYKNTKLLLSHFSTIFKIAHSLKISEIIICADEIEDGVKSFAKQINSSKITFINTAEFFNKYAKNKPLPKAIIDIDKPKLNRTELISYAFSPARARHYLLFGLLILATSFLVPFKIYYLIWGSLMCVIALIIKLVPLLKKN